MPQHIKHSDLKRFSDSYYKSKCPGCENGILLVRRNKDLSLYRLDTCISCGKSFWYTDIDINGEVLTDDENVKGDGC